MSARRAEIEAKRAKLAELRRAREERAARMHSGSALSASQSSGAGTPEPRQTLEELVASLVGDVPAARADVESGGVAPAEPQSKSAATQVHGEPAATLALGEQAATLGQSSPRAEALGEPAATLGQSSPRAEALGKPAATLGEPAATLGQSSPRAEAPPPPERILYSKEVQTDPPEAPAETTQAPAAPTTPAAPAPAAPPAPTAPTVAADELPRDYTDFLHSKAIVMERMLDERYDVLTDYTHVPGDADEAERASLRLVRTMMDESLLESRAVTDLDWSTRHPELVAVSYNRKRVLAHEDDHDGLVAVWNMHVRDRPEFTFFAPTDVVSVLASPYHPNLFVGGALSGQVLLWDTRHRHLPVQRTPIDFGGTGAGGHSAPVYSLRLIGPAQAHQLVSASTDGRVCTWSLDMLAHPQEHITLTNPLHPRSPEVGVASLDVAAGDATRFLVGTDEGNIFAASRYDRAGTPAGLDLTHVYVGHSAPVTRVESHPSRAARGRRAPVDLSDVFLSTSMDWTTALWRVASAAATSAVQPSAGAAPSAYHYPHANARIATSQRTNPLAFRGGASSQAPWRAITPLARLENQQDYVMDARWHPQHPGVFAQVDAGGRLDVYNMAQSLERPMLSATAPDARGLNRVAWEKRGTLEHEETATRVAVGGVDGRVHVYEVAEPLVTPSDADWLDVHAALQRADAALALDEGTAA